MATWNAAYESNPSNLGAASAGYVSIRDPKTEVRIRMQNEHDTSTRASSGADGSRIKDWVHIQGAARTYYTTATPTSRPDGSTALSSNDDGRLFTQLSGSFKVWSGATFDPMSPNNQKNSRTMKYAQYSLGNFSLPNGFESYEIRIGGGWDPPKYVSLPDIPSNATITKTGILITEDTQTIAFAYPFLIKRNYLAPPDDTDVNLVTFLSGGRWHISMWHLITTSILTLGTFTNPNVNRGWVTVWYYE